MNQNVEDVASQAAGVQCCGTCKHWTQTDAAWLLKRGRYGECGAPLPYAVEHAERMYVVAAFGTSCPCYQRRDGA